MVALVISVLASGCAPATQSHKLTGDAEDMIAAETAVHGTPVQVIDKVGGRELFVRYCASCHGMDGRGDGPAAEVLAVAVPDLTRLGRGGGESFPMSRVEKAIREARPGVHGSTRMPVWGPDLMGAGDNWTEAQRKAFLEKRVRKLAKYLESIQVEGA